MEMSMPSPPPRQPGLCVNRRRLALVGILVGVVCVAAIAIGIISWQLSTPDASSASSASSGEDGLNSDGTTTSFGDTNTTPISPSATPIPTIASLPHASFHPSSTPSVSISSVPSTSDSPAVSPSTPNAGLMSGSPSYFPSNTGSSDPSVLIASSTPSVSPSESSGLTIDESSDASSENPTVASSSPPTIMPSEEPSATPTTTPDFSFRILQMTDFHFGEGRFYDAQTYNCMSSVIQSSLPLDLIVLSGDQLTANNMDEDAGDYQTELSEFLQAFGVPWALTFGNHDDQPDEGPSPWAFPPMPARNGTGLTKTSRRTLIEIDQAQPFSLTQIGPESVHGVSNYAFNILDPNRPSDDPSAVKLQALFLDTGGGTIEQIVDETQVDWFLETRNPSVPGFLFQHIPTSEYTYNADICSGMAFDGVSAVSGDAGIVSVMDENMLFMGTGHNHGSDYCCPVVEIGVTLCYGRRTGYGGYGSWERGGRVYEITIKAADDAVNWSSYVILEDGSRIHEYSSGASSTR